MARAQPDKYLRSEDVGLTLVCLVIFGAFAIIHLDLTYDGVRSPSWPLTTGEVITWDVVHHVERGYHTCVSYRYSVAGRQYTGDRFSFAHHCPGPAHRPRVQASRAVEWMQRDYPIGGTVRVRYDPAAHHVAVLRPGLQGNDHVVLGLTIVVFVGGTVSALALLLGWYRSSARQRDGTG